jgi:hypothetical protein
MEHVPENKLLDALQRPGSLDQQSQAHLAECASCQQRLQELQIPWDALADWTVDIPETDLTERILQQAQSPRTVRRWPSHAWLRIAASILIGVGLGTFLSRSSSSAIQDDQVAQALYLDVLSLNSSTGWTSPLLIVSEEPAADDE